MMERRTKSIAVSTSAISAVALAILIRYSSNRRAENSRAGPRTDPHLQATSDQGPEDSFSTKARSGWKRLRRLPPQWVVFLVMAGTLVIAGFCFLPPSQSQDLSGESSPIIDVSVSRPDVHLLAALDASRADSGDLYLGFYADGVPGGFRWRITSSDYLNDLSTTAAITEPDGQWADELTGQTPSSDNALYFLMTTQSFTPDLQSALRDRKYTPTVERGIRLDISSSSLAGANF